MTDSSKAKIGQRMQERLDAMDEPTRRAAIRKAQARMLLISAAREAGYPLETKEQIQHALDEMRKAAKD